MGTSHDEASDQQREWAKLYSKMQGPLLRAAMQRGLSRDCAQDVVQSTFQKAMECIGSYQERSCLDSWIWGIFRNLVHVSIRATSHGASIPLENYAAWKIVSSDLYGPFELRDRDLLMSVEGLLPPHLSAALIHHAIYGMTGAEIAEILDVNISTVYTWLTKASERLAEEL